MKYLFYIFQGILFVKVFLKGSALIYNKNVEGVYFRFCPDS